MSRISDAIKLALGALNSLPDGVRDALRNPHVAIAVNDLATKAPTA